MKRLTAVLSGTVITVAGAIALAQPAYAAWTETVCVSQGVVTAFGSGTVTLCNTVRFRIQDDGNGRRAEHMWWDITRGCGLLETPGQPKIKASTMTGRAPFGNVFSQQNTGALWYCSGNRNLELRGPETGAMQAVLDAEMNLDGANNYMERVVVNSD